MVELIGLYGLAGSGKDTVAGILKDRGYVRLSFGDAIKDAVYKLNPLVPKPGSTCRYITLQELVNKVGWDKAKQEPEVRRLLQVFGTEVGRDQFGKFVWVDKVMRKIMDKGYYVITDVRFPNEADEIKKYGGYVFKVERDGVTPMTHASETAMKNYDFDGTIKNNGTLDDLRTAVGDALRTA